MANFSDVLNLGNLFLSGYGAYTSNRDASASRDALTRAMNANTQTANSALTRDWSLQDRILGQTGQITSNITAALQAMGGAPTVTQGDIDAEAARRMTQYGYNANRAIQYAISQSEADRIRSGMDMSTYDIMKDRENADFAYNTLNAAYTQAYQDSVSYLTGANDAIMKSRSAALTELTAPYDSALKYETSMYGVGAGLSSKLSPTNVSSLASIYGDDTKTASSSAVNLGQVLQKAINDGTFNNVFDTNTDPTARDWSKAIIF